MDEKFYTAQEIAKILKVSYMTVFRWIRAEKLTAFKAGRQYRITYTELQKFINNETK